MLNRYQICRIKQDIHGFKEGEIVYIGNFIATTIYIPLIWSFLEDHRKCIHVPEEYLEPIAGLYVNPDKFEERVK